MEGAPPVWRPSSSSSSSSGAGPDGVGRADMGVFDRVCRRERARIRRVVKVEGVVWLAVLVQRAVWEGMVLVKGQLLMRLRQWEGEEVRVRVGGGRRG